MTKAAPTLADPSVTLIIGAGHGTGAALASRFAAAGHIICLARRNREKLDGLLDSLSAQGVNAHGYCFSASDEQDLVDAIAEIETTIGPIEIAIYNATGYSKSSILELTSADFRKGWEESAFGGFVLGREVSKRMIERGRGTILYTGATASLRGKEDYAALASGKTALRTLAQSMARELGPRGIHVAHIVIDGGIDTPLAREHYGDIMNEGPPDRFLKPEDIAETYWSLHQQPKSAWTHELDLRPWVETW